jgi:hypothetical protein
MSTPLSQIFALLGKLDDSPGEDGARERFRRYIRENIREVGIIRDYVEECLRTAGDPYNRALQDFATYIGHFLGFEVTFGRYRGVQGQAGFDGYWKSPTGLYVVIEVKTTEVYAVKASTLVGYVDELISDKKIPNWDHALGLYVVGRPDPEIHQLENAIKAEKRLQQLRVASVESLLSLAEMMNEYDVTHEDILAVLRPSGPSIDPLVDFITRVVAQAPSEEGPEEGRFVPVSTPTSAPPASSPPAGVDDVAFWLTPVKDDDQQRAEQVIGTLVGQHKLYAFGERTPGRKHMKTGDRICFYATGNGVLADAEIVAPPERKSDARVRHPDLYPWLVRLDSVNLYLEKPVVIDASTRARLDAFYGRDPKRSWAWFVQATKDVSAKDFRLLTRGESTN